MTRSVLIPVQYDHYNPYAIIIGIRPAPAYESRYPQHLLRRLHADMPGWATLALATQEPVRFSRHNQLRIVASQAGSAVESAPAKGWRP